MTAFKTALLFSIAATLVAGCAAPDPGTRYKDDRLMPPPPVSTPEPAGPPAVFGRFRVTRDGEESKINTFQWTGGLYCSALVHSEADNKGIVRRFDESGWFGWSLGPGTYVLADIVCGRKNALYTLPLGLRFEVPAEGPVSYFGQLSVDYTDDHFRKLEWDSEVGQASAEFARRFPDKILITDRPAVPDRGPGDFTNLVSICAAQWQLKCSQKLQGVEPLNPTVDRGMRGVGFAAVDGITPTLRWKAGADSSLTYDVVIWEDVQYAVPGRTLHEPGRVVVYAENLAGAEFAVSDGLKPATKYFWSVRLRRGSEVSSWSRGGHEFNVFFYASRSSGQWFGFETP